MKNENEAIGNLLIEMEEMDKASKIQEDAGTYSITVDYGALFTLLCC